MNKELDFNSIAAESNFAQRANPVFNTAKTTLFQLAASEDKNANIVADKLGVTFDNSHSSTNTKIPMEITTINNLMLEMRYKTIGKMAVDSNCPIIMDLPCGYMPRGLEIIEKNIHYVGVDLPVTIEEGSPVIFSLSDEKKRDLLRLKGADATNYRTLEDALSGLDGELCITTEGLMMYLTDSEIGELCDNIAKLLRKHGGCWITADIEASLQFILIARPLFGERFMDIMAQMKKTFGEKSDIQVGPRALVIGAKEGAEGMKKAMMFLAKHGLKAERMIVAEHMPKLNMLSKIESEKAKAIMEAMHQCAYWKITLLDSGSSADEPTKKEHDFDVKPTLNDEMLFLEIRGRVDSMNAPKLLAFWEKTVLEEAVSSITIDCKD
ncbi:MAG: hypothetical protein II721_06915, partial [Bacilli bacterium]|nr:hypothetical protein [Bacilli bacterium]